jgi:hypothetical protein
MNLRCSCGRAPIAPPGAVLQSSLTPHGDLLPLKDPVAYYIFYLSPLLTKVPPPGWVEGKFLSTYKLCTYLVYI